MVNATLLQQLDLLAVTLAQVDASQIAIAQAVKAAILGVVNSTGLPSPVTSSVLHVDVRSYRATSFSRDERRDSFPAVDVRLAITSLTLEGAPGLKYHAERMAAAFAGLDASPNALILNLRTSLPGLAALRLTAASPTVQTPSTLSPAASTTPDSLTPVPPAAVTAGSQVALALGLSFGLAVAVIIAVVVLQRTRQGHPVIGLPPGAVEMQANPAFQAKPAYHQPDIRLHQPQYAAVSANAWRSNSSDGAQAQTRA